MQNRKILAAALACALGAAALTGCTEDNAAQQATSASQARPPAEVKVITVKASDHAIDTVLTGRTSAYHVAEVRPQVNGILQKRLFTEGAQVKAGEALYQIDPAPYEANLKSAQATLSQARADAKRSAELVKIKAVSVQSNDAAQAALKTAEAAVEAGRAAVNTAKIDLGYTKVLSPISGRVSRSEVTEGALMTAYQAQILTTVQQLDPIYVDVTQTAEDMLRIRREIEQGVLKADKDGNARVTLALADGTAYGLEGKLTFTDAQVEESTGTVKLRAVFPNPKFELMPGMYVRARLLEGVRPESILVNMQCVMRDTKGTAYVYVVTPDNQVERRAIVVSRTEGTNWLVDSGLKDGERVIFEGFQRTAPGATVKPVEFNPADLPAPKPLFE